MKQGCAKGPQREDLQCDRDAIGNIAESHEDIFNRRKPKRGGDQIDHAVHGFVEFRRVHDKIVDREKFDDFFGKRRPKIKCG